MADNRAHWGDWIIARSRVLGFRRQRDFAKEIGCTPEHLSRWAQLEQPPSRMWKGYDDLLARALRIDKKTLFRDFVQIDPAYAPTVTVGADEEVPWEAADPDDEFMLNVIHEKLKELRGEELKKVSQYLLTLAEERPPDQPTHRAPTR